MRFPSDNKGEMIRWSITDSDIERLLSGSDPEDSELMALVPSLSMLRSYGAWLPPESSVEGLASEAASIARPWLEPSDGTRGPPFFVETRRTTLTPRLVGALAALLLFFGMTGMAVAADGAAPGDALYGLDRALENAGIGAGRVEERIEEANQLVAQGRAQEALGHVTEAFDEAQEDGEDVSDLAEARSAIEAAVSRLPEVETEAATGNVDEDVEALLRYIRENVQKDVGEDGREFGQRVAALARLIAVNEEGGQTTDDATTTSTTDDRGNGNGNNGNGSGNNGTGNGNGNGNGNNGNGNGPPDGSPSETAPGRGDKP